MVLRRRTARGPVMIGLAIVCALPFVVLAILLLVDPAKLRPTTTGAAPVNVPHPLAQHVDPFAGHPMHCKCPNHR